MVPKYGEPNAGKRTGVGLKLTTLQRNVGQKWLDGILTGQVTITTHRFGKLFAANFFGVFWTIFFLHCLAAKGTADADRSNDNWQMRCDCVPR